MLGFALKNTLYIGRLHVKSDRRPKNWKIRDSIHTLSSAQTLLATDSTFLDRKK